MFKKKVFSCFQHHPLYCTCIKTVFVVANICIYSLKVYTSVSEMMWSLDWCSPSLSVATRDLCLQYQWNGMWRRMAGRRYSHGCLVHQRNPMVVNRSSQLLSHHMCTPYPYWWVKQGVTCNPCISHFCQLLIWQSCLR